MKENVLAWICLVVGVLVWFVLNPLPALIVSYVLAGITAYLILGFRITDMKTLRGQMTLTVLVFFGFIALYTALKFRKMGIPWM
jgi:4-hydroxybenzoate polyprenyltransferase